MFVRSSLVLAASALLSTATFAAEEPAAPAAAPAERPAAKPVKAKKICRTMKQSVSRIGSRVCKTEEEWAKSDAAEPMENPMAPRSAN